MQACAFSIQVFDVEFEVVPTCAFMVDTERCRLGLVAISAISFLTVARSNELRSSATITKEPEGAAPARWLGNGSSP
jgi:hypothetical protein